MKKLLFALGLVLAALVPATQAQWQNVTYTLKGGWNAIFLHGDASHATLEQHFASNPEVVAVWRWNTNPTQVQFGGSSLVPNAGTPEWSVWTRGAATGNTLSSLRGQTAYLVQCSGAATSTYTVTIAQKPQPPTGVWVRNGANLLGFPTRLTTDYPTFASYFATFPAALSGKIYRYTGGELGGTGATNPVQVFQPATERIDRNQAYWFEAPVVSNFYAPLEISSSDLNGLHYGRNGALMTVRVRNRTAATITLTVAPVLSATAPTGQEQITGGVPLTRRTFNAGTGLYTETALGTGFSEALGPQSSIELSFGIDRALMTGNADALYASLVRFSDSGGLLDVLLPASARVTSLAGLWLGEIALNGVESKAVGYPGTATQMSFPLRTLLHIDNGGTARLLSQAFMGKLAPSPNNFGLCTREAGLLASDKASATRFISAHMPLDTELSSGTGTVGLGNTLVRTIIVPFGDRTNPFVHAYHPDHDNKDARFNPVGAGVESYTITRVCRFTFTLTPPAGMSSLGWGSSVLGGTYSETISGLHRDTITVTGTFQLRRVSELGDITLN